MDAEALRVRQAPLKERYKADPASARVVSGAHGRFSDPGITATIEGWAGPIRGGQHVATGGDGTDACSADLLMQALLACAGVTFRAVTTSMGVQVADVELEATCSWDARGTLGLARDVPVGVTDVVVTITIDSDADDGRLQRIAASTERYCVVGQSLTSPATIHVINRR
ncbi:OsmC family protein [Microbacterium rhizosphaerae]|uniref:OsmC family protein n=1 Tax=Microbacterium rhizosphaerae TaxID=1678237 RepID=A0ABZ0SK03_9MICO|nr:OsmC family protein [Microbacterium rhizosphaerae]WPR89726.1 OsmC family protein [Microbacterium rhizosphaerae]